MMRCGDDVGRGIGAGHVCKCVRRERPPLDSERPHGCSCGAPWADPGCYICQPDNPEAADEGCAACEREYWASVIPRAKD